MASAWLIRRFIDPDARFAFAPAQGYLPQRGALRFDMFEAEFTHEGDQCTFETLVARFGLQANRALRAVAEIVHDIDVKDAKYGRAEAPGVERVVAGIAVTSPADMDRLERGALLFEALYGALSATDERRPPLRSDRAASTRPTQDTMAKTNFMSVDKYLASQPEAVQGVLERVRRIIRRAVPGAEEVISYQIPAYKLHGAAVLYFAGWKQHYSLYPATRRLIAAFTDDLAPYEVHKGTIRFPLSRRVPEKLIARIAKFRAREVAKGEKTKTAAPKKRREGKKGKGRVAARVLAAQR